MEMPSENYSDFTVFITEPDGKSGIVAEATTMDTEIAINNVLCTQDVNRLKSLSRFERSLNEYIGPDFQTLDERIQQSLNDYLEEFGVNEYLAAFIESMSLDKDQRMYMAWLSDLKDFVN